MYLHKTFPLPANRSLRLALRLVNRLSSLFFQMQQEKQYG